MTEVHGVRLEKLGTVLLGVRDTEKSLAFYRDVLGLAVQFSSGELTFLDAGGVTLALRLFTDLKDTTDERRVELVFHVANIDAAYAALKGRGVQFRIAPRVVTGEILAADFRDPDGHVLSIVGPRA
jgi:catechol 2,3-dioxygenase-like lactoylglutathione lyase family enzyme